MLDGASREIGCSECVELLADYIDGTLPRDQTDAARRLRESTDAKLPAELRQKLIAFLKRSDAAR